MCLLVRQHGAAEGFELDHAHDAQPEARLAAGGIDELVAVDIETRAPLTPQDAVGEPVAKEGRRARVLVVLRRV